MTKVLNINILNNIKDDLKDNFYKDKKSNILLKNTEVLTITFNIKDFQYNNFQDIIDKWKNNKKWKDKVDAYFEVDDENLIYYFKIKKIEIDN